MATKKTTTKSTAKKTTAKPAAKKATTKTVAKKPATKAPAKNVAAKPAAKKKNMADIYNTNVSILLAMAIEAMILLLGYLIIMSAA